MISRAEDKIIDKLGIIDPHGIMSLFSCSLGDAEDIIQGYFNRTKIVRANIILNGSSRIKTLGSVSEVEGGVSIWSSTIEDFGKLRHAESLQLDRLTLTTLGKLRTCDSLTITNCNDLVDLGNLEYVFKNCSIKHCDSIDGVGFLRNVGGNLKLYDNKNLSNFEVLDKVGGDLIIKNCPIESLEPLRHIEGNLDIRESMLSVFGSLSNIDGFIIAMATQVTDLDRNNDSVRDFSKLSSIFHVPNNLIYINVPKIDNLTDVDIMLIDDGDLIDEVDPDVF
jgi:hypothetical protein